MICRKCGAQNPGDAKFCGACGTALAGKRGAEPTARPQTARPKKSAASRRRSGAAVIAVSAALAAAVAVLILFMISGPFRERITALTQGLTAKQEEPGRYVLKEDGILFQPFYETYKTAVLFNFKPLEPEIEGMVDGDRGVMASADGKTVLCMSGDSRLLYVIDQGRIRKIAENAADIFRISEDGSTAAYLLSAQDTCDAFLYRIGDAEAETVYSAMPVSRIPGDASLLLSPDGSTLVYTLLDEHNTRSVYWKTGAETVRLDGLRSVFALTEHGERVYGTDADGRLTVYERKSDRYTPLADTGAYALANVDHTEILFSSSADGCGEWYIESNGEKRALDPQHQYAGLCPIIPDDRDNDDLYDYQRGKVRTFFGTVMEYGSRLDTVTGEKTGWGIGYIDENGTLREIATDMGYAKVSANGDTVGYTQDGELYAAMRASGFAPEKIGPDPQVFQLSPDGKRVYYLTEEQGLFCYTEGESRRIADDVKAVFPITAKGTVFYTADNGKGAHTLWRCASGKEAEVVAEEIEAAGIFLKAIVYGRVADDGTQELYVSTDELHFERVLLDYSETRPDQPPAAETGSDFGETVTDNTDGPQGVMTYEEYRNADLDEKVMIETYVQAKQSWWEGGVSVYAQDTDGAYFIENMACSQADADRLMPGTRIRVTGYKAEWGEATEIAEATFEILPDSGYIAPVTDVTGILGEEDQLRMYQNRFVAFRGLTVEAADETGAAYRYNWDGSGKEGDDLYFSASLGGRSYTFTVKSYLCDKDSAVYKAVQQLEVGQTLDMEGFLHWYKGADPHITRVTVR